ncbi:MAG: ABC transporter substrate-binding protein [Candidatus Methylomirabilia bacterium]
MRTSLTWRGGALASVLALALLMFLFQGTGAAETPVRGGTLTYVVPASWLPSYDGHWETTFAMIHPIRPFYSLLIKVNPQNPGDPTDFVGDVAKSWSVSNDGRVYTFKIRKGIKFHDGSPLTSRDVKATYEKIIWPPEGVRSARNFMYNEVVEAVDAPDDFTVVFRLNFPSAAFLPAMATPFNFIYKADIIKKDPRWYKTHIMGTGAFKPASGTPEKGFADGNWSVKGSHIEGVRNPDYFTPGRPYLDGYRAIFAKKQSPQVAAIRGERAMINFRALPPKTIGDLKAAMGDKIRVQESAWNCALFVNPNHKVKPFDDPRVRRALSLALDRYEASRYLSKFAIIKPVGGVVFPAHPLAATKQELQQIAGYWPDIKKSRKEARRLLHEAGVPDGFKFTFHNRAIEQPYKHMGIWLIDQWRKIGLNVEHWVQPTGPFYKTLRGRTQAFQVSMDFNCQSVVNPILDVAKFLSEDKSGSNHAEYVDRTLDHLHAKMVREGDPKKVQAMMRKFEKRVLDEQAHYLVTLWWNRTVPHNARLRGWKVGPSHYLNQHLVDVWLAPK